MQDLYGLKYECDEEMNIDEVSVIGSNHYTLDGPDKYTNQPKMGALEYVLQDVYFIFGKSSHHSA